MSEAESRRRDRSRSRMPGGRLLVLGGASLSMLAAIAAVIMSDYLQCTRAVILRVDPAELTVRDGEMDSFEVEAVALGGGGRRLDCEISFTVEGDVVEILGERRFRCAKPGKGTIVASLGDRLKRDLKVRCAQADSIKASGPRVLKLGGPPQRPEVAVYSGEESIPDANVEIKSLSPKVVKVENGFLIPISVGRAGIQFRSGQASAILQVEVGERILSEFFEIPDGGAAQWRLQPGHYAIEIQSHPEEGGGKDGVTLTWTGAFCPNQEEKQIHRFSCFVEQDAFLRLYNPPPKIMFMTKTTVSGYLSATRVP